MALFHHEKTKGQKVIIIVIAFLLIILSFFAGLYFAGKNSVMEKLSEKEAIYLGKLNGKYSNAKDGTLSQDINFDLFWETWDALNKNFADKDKLNDKKMFYGALEGMVSTTGDPYTVFMDPNVSKEFNEDMEGSFEGIGAEIGIKNHILIVIAPLPDSPAQKGGLKPGDKIIAINKESTEKMPIDEAIHKIRGKKDTDVVLSIFREGDDNFKDVTIKRGKIIVKSVKTKYLADKNIYIIEMSNFNGDTMPLLNEAINDIVAKNPKGIILDLRNNPGGYLDSAVEVVSEWIEDGIVVSEKYSEDNKSDELARGRARLSSFPTVVLVNEGSASASEIVAGALQDFHKAKIVGMKTFGKGSVQKMIPLSDGSNLKVTEAKWLTPNGKNINEEGITPDVEIDLTKEDYDNNKDPQMEKAVEILTKNNS